jgi:hypothetical protein
MNLNDNELQEIKQNGFITKLNENNERCFCFTEEHFNNEVMFPIMQNNKELSAMADNIVNAVVEYQSIRDNEQTNT